MPKAAKPPVTPRPRPRPIRSPRKVVEKPLIDDEAEESDDGVLINQSDAEADKDPFGHPASHPANKDDEYDKDFINDGDPFEEINAGDYELRSVTPDITPPTSPSKRTKNRKDVVPNLYPPVNGSPSRIRRGRPSAVDEPITPSPTKVNKPARVSSNIDPSDDVIEVDTTSDEDMEHMDQDDSMFRKPTGVKASALPPSLATRSTASRIKTTSSTASPNAPAEFAATSGSHFLRSKAGGSNIAISSLPASLRGPPFIIDGVKTPAFFEVVDAFSSDQKLLGPSSAPIPDTVETDRVDHDQVELERGIRSSLGLKSRPLRQISPDWDPPYAGDVISEILGTPVPVKSAGNLSHSSKKQVLATDNVSDNARVDATTVPISDKRKSSATSAAGSAATTLSGLHVTLGTKRKGVSTRAHPTGSDNDGFDAEVKSASPPKKHKAASLSRKGKGKAIEHVDSDVEHSDNGGSPNVSKAIVADEDTKTGALSSSSRSNKASDRDGNLPSYLPATKKPVIPSIAPGNSPPLTMSQFLRASKGDSEIVEDTAPKDTTPPIDPDPVFLEDLETYKAYFDPEAPCGVSDPDLQDESLKPHYIGLHPLPKNRRILPAFDRSRNSLEDIDWTTGGRVKFSSWFDQNPRMLAANSMGAMLFQSAEPNYVNLSRVSPLELSSRVSSGSSQTLRLHVGDRVAVCVSAVCCTESHVVVPKKLGTKTDRQKKWLSGVLHDQDWERLEAVSSLVFNEDILYGQIADKAVSFQTMISPLDSEQTPERVTRSVPSRMFSTRSPGKPSNTTPFKSDRAKTLLAHNDPIPVYDARKTIVDFSSDLDRLGDVLPSFPGEVPVGSFTVVGYTCSSYRGAISGSNDRVAHISFNILWAVVCGTPGLRSSRS